MTEHSRDLHGLATQSTWAASSRRDFKQQRQYATTTLFPMWKP